MSHILDKWEKYYSVNLLNWTKDRIELGIKHHSTQKEFQINIDCVDTFFNLDEIIDEHIKQIHKEIRDETLDIILKK